MSRSTTANETPGRGAARALEATAKSTVHAGALRHLSRTLEDAGLDPRPLLAEAGAGEADLTDPDRRIPMRSHVALWRLAASRFPGVALGLTVGTGFELDHGNLLTYMAAHSSTLGEAVRCAERYRHLVHETLLPILEVEGGEARLRQPPCPAVDLIGALAEANVATWVKSFSLYLGSAWWPREVWFQHAAPRDLRPYDEAFRCRVRFGRPETRMITDREALDQPLRLANPRLGAYLEEHARAELDRLPREDGLADRVRRLLVEELRGGDPSQDRIARRVALSPRTLQRRLRDEGVAFNDLLEEQRREACERYLRDPSLSIQQIAFLLGYTERSGFYRAFRRWTGRTPQEVRDGSRCSA